MKDWIIGVPTYTSLHSSGWSEGKAWAFRMFGTTAEDSASAVLKVAACLGAWERERVKPGIVWSVRENDGP